MRLHVMHDRQGRILAASEAGETSQDLGTVPIPVALQPDHTVVELDVPADVEGAGLLEICRRLRVDPERKQLVDIDDHGRRFAPD